MRHQIDTPAMRRLEWLLDGLAGVEGRGTAAGEMLALLNPHEGSLAAVLRRVSGA